MQGRLLSNDGKSLTLKCGPSGSQTIAFEEVTSTFRVSRRTGPGVLLGSVIGSGVGLVVAAWVDHGQEEGTWFQSLQQIDEKIWTFVLVTLGGGIVGGLIGGLIGHSTQRLGPVQLEALPLCWFQAGDTAPLRVNLVVDF